MQITDILAQTGGLQAMSRELGISETDAARGAAALAPDKEPKRKRGRSGGVPGEVNVGRPIAPLARITVARRRPFSGVLFRSMISCKVGVSARRASRLRPV